MTEHEIFEKLKEALDYNYMIITQYGRLVVYVVMIIVVIYYSPHI